MPRITITGVRKNELWTSRETAEFLGLGPNTLPVWRHRGKGPKWIKHGERVCYRVGDIVAWLRKNPWAKGAYL